MGGRFKKFGQCPKFGSFFFDCFPKYYFKVNVYILEYIEEARYSWEESQAKARGREKKTEGGCAGSKDCDWYDQETAGGN